MIFQISFVLITISLVALINFSQGIFVNNNYTDRNDKQQQQQCKSSEPEVRVDFDSVSVFPKFNFNPSWIIRQKHFWKSEDFDFELRFVRRTLYYEQSKSKLGKLRDVKVFLVPYSHNDPGWKKTFEGYYYSHTKHILDNAMLKLMEYQNMTFVWNEISFLARWWDDATSGQKADFKLLIETGRLEILTGGWVMPDEASPSLFALLNQLIDGHDWLAQYLGIVPKSSFSIDPFGHGSTMGYLLKKSGINGMMIQRLHFMWKHWFAENQKGDFIWYPNWSSDSEDAILCHNAHYDLYPTKHSCGPNPITCMSFDFRNIPGLREEQQAYSKPPDQRVLSEESKKLANQYKRTASLTKHNQVLTLLGGDFRYEEGLEWDQQYQNYMQLFDYINSHKDEFETNVKFGTISEYFEAVKNSNVTLPTFRGDFFPYRNDAFDVIFPFSPGYWTGYYSTRPYWKKLSREAEDQLLKAEIIFIVAYNFLRQQNQSSFEILGNNYDNLVYARRVISLFQHHDGITGTSPRTTMLDYARKLTKAWNFSKQMQRMAIEVLWKYQYDFRANLQPLQFKMDSTSIVEHEVVKILDYPDETYGNCTILTCKRIKPEIVKKIVLYNSLGWKRLHLVRLTVEETVVLVKDMKGEIITAQINPKFERGSYTAVEGLHELLFMAELPPLSLVTYEIQRDLNNYTEDSNPSKTVPAFVSHMAGCSAAAEAYDSTDRYVLENPYMTAFLDNDTCMVKKMEYKRGSKLKADLKLSLGQYEAGIGGGAYLLHPLNTVLKPIINKAHAVTHLIEGPITSEVVVITKTMRFATWLLQKATEELGKVLYISNEFKGTEFAEYILQAETDLDNDYNKPSIKSLINSKTKKKSDKAKKAEPMFFTDTNGLAVQKRVTVPSLHYQENNYPVTSYAYLQDVSRGLRLSLAMDRSHGMSSMEIGKLELIFDRILPYDDGRGMEEGVIDPEASLSNYAIKLESIPKKLNESKFSGYEPTLALQRLSKMLNSPPTIFTHDAFETAANLGTSFLSGEIPDHVHLLNFRTVSHPPSQGMRNIPSNTALMILQNMGHLDTTPTNPSVRNCNISSNSSNSGTAAGGRAAGYRTVNNNATSTIIPSSSSYSSKNLKLKASLLLSHSVQETNLVGTMSSQSSHIHNMKYVTVGKPYELKSYLLHF